MSCHTFCQYKVGINIESTKFSSFLPSLLDNRLNLALAVNDPFGWNITKSKAYYSNYVVNISNDVHSHAFTFRVSWSFGRNKVSNVYRDSKERESNRFTKKNFMQEYI